MIARLKASYKEWIFSQAQECTVLDKIYVMS